MSVNSVYLVIHSHSRSEDKPSFRVASAELPKIPSQWTGHDRIQYAYTSIGVTMSRTTLAEKWYIELEYPNNSEQYLEIVAWFNDLEAADKKLADCVLQGCNPNADTDEEDKTGRKKVNATWTDSLDGNTAAFYRIDSRQENLDGTFSQAMRSHWWEVIRVDLEQPDVYSAKWNEKDRSSYLETSERINSLLTLKRAQGLNEQELEELDRLQKGLGWVGVKRVKSHDYIGGYVKRSEEDSDGVKEYLKNENVQYSSEDEEDLRVRKMEPGYWKLDVEDREVMGDNVWGDKL
ncbi:hypothetical protein J4E90_006406 [Alternaria incomplexa]|uniref:uncharacterized protein n=1 Tax=Alternaria incomplexa TaxID=1187928 RepID=UPI00221E8149|nr:uncharacterized protein J4E90_006406 [Alternaria incomplexa]KAI4911589.1 hypothetical protein J4E90_006406 [Alternaria incomplexa]